MTCAQCQTRIRAGVYCASCGVLLARVRDVEAELRELRAEFKGRYKPKPAGPRTPLGARRRR